VTEYGVTKTVTSAHCNGLTTITTEWDVTHPEEEHHKITDITPDDGSRKNITEEIKNPHWHYKNETVITTNPPTTVKTITNDTVDTSPEVNTVDVITTDPNGTKVDETITTTDGCEITVYHKVIHRDGRISESTTETHCDGSKDTTDKETYVDPDGTHHTDVDTDHEDSPCPAALY